MLYLEIAIVALLICTNGVLAMSELAVVSARDAEALRSLQRPLPHYGAQSWLVFEDGRALERGTWPAPGRVIPVLAAE